MSKLAANTMIEGITIIPNNGQKNLNMQWGIMDKEVTFQRNKKEKHFTTI